MELEKELEDLWDEYESKVSLIADKVYKESVPPFCEANQLKLTAGSGDWSLLPEETLKPFS